MIPVGWTDSQYFEALRINDLSEGPKRKKVIEAFEKKHKVKWPKWFPSRNPAVQEAMKSDISWKDVVTNTRVHSAKPPY